MLIFVSYLISIFIVTLGFGLIVNNYLTKLNLIESFSLGEIGLLGFYILLLISYLLHFLIPLNYLITSSIFILGVLFFFYFQKKLVINLEKKYFVIIFILILPALISAKGHPDLEWYFLPYLNYIKEFKIIFGIANINDFLGFQSWNDIVGMFRFPIVDVKGLNLIPAVFSIYILICFIELSHKTSNTSLKVFIYLIILFAISKYYKIYEYGGHVPPILLGFLINIYFYKLILESQNNFKDIFCKILIFSSFVLLLRINYIFLLPIFLYIFIKYPNIFFKFILDKRIFFLIILIPLIHFSKNIIHTGCFVYPVESTCFSKEIINWSVGKQYAKLRYDGVSAGVKGWNQHVIIDGDIDDRIDYLIPLKEKKILSHTKYIEKGNFFWIKYWIKSGDAKKVLNNFLIVSISFVLIFFIGNFNTIVKFKKINGRFFLTPFCIFFIQLVLWFFLTSQTIYGGDVATIVFISFLASYFLQNLNFNTLRTKFVFLFLLLVSLSYFEIKNIQRVYKDYFIEDNIFPWIKIKNNQLNIDYYKLIIDSNTFNIQKKIVGRHVGLPDECGNTPMLCIPYDRIKCVSGVKKKSEYLFISGNEKACIEHLEERAFY